MNEVIENTWCWINGRKLTKVISVMLAGVTLCGCASAYKAPEQTYRPAVVTGSGDVYKQAVAALISEGFAVASFDQNLGIISTQRRQMDLTESDADLGSTSFGIQYIKDKRTTEFVTVTLQVKDSQATIRADIEAEYLPNDPVYGKKMVGVSKGTIEKRIASRIH